jgi:hypothetical protein
MVELILRSDGVVVPPVENCAQHDLHRHVRISRDTRMVTRGLKVANSQGQEGPNPAITDHWVAIYVGGNGLAPKAEHAPPAGQVLPTSCFFVCELTHNYNLS